MLSESSAAVVTATLPAVRAHGEAITGRFYRRMFDAHPELLDLFNRGDLLRRGVPARRIAYEVFGPGMLPG